MKYTVTIKENKDFLSLYKRGNYTAGKNVVVYYKKNRTGRTALGITVGKKVGNAVTRSRCRRIIRAAYQSCEEQLPKGFDYVIMARPGCGEAKSTHIAAFLRGKVIPAMKSANTKRK